MRFAFIDAEKALYPVRLMCRVLQVAASGYYAWRQRGPSERSQQDAALGARLVALHREHREVYGSPRLHVEIKAQGFEVGRHRIARLMRQHGLVACRPKRFRKTTDSTHTDPVAPNTLQRNFTTNAPNRVWVSDLTYVWTWEGWLYLAVVIDLYSRRVVGWATAEHLRVELALEALRMALGLRTPELGALTHHSDRGSQYAANDHRAVLAQHGIAGSMSRKGDCWDNAVAESFFATLKKELIHRDSWATRREARAAIGDYIGLFYNARRRHSYLGYRSPMEFEKSFNQRAAQAA